MAFVAFNPSPPTQKNKSKSFEIKRGLKLTDSGHTLLIVQIIKSNFSSGMSKRLYLLSLKRRSFKIEDEGEVEAC
jgi:hypothetical protein